MRYADNGSIHWKNNFQTYIYWISHSWSYKGRYKTYAPMHTKIFPEISFRNPKFETAQLCKYTHVYTYKLGSRLFSELRTFVHQCWAWYCSLSSLNTACRTKCLAFLKKIIHFEACALLIVPVIFHIIYFSSISFYPILCDADPRERTHHAYRTDTKLATVALRWTPPRGGKWTEKQRQTYQQDRTRGGCTQCFARRH